MVYAFAGLAVVFLALWRLAVSGRKRWRARAGYWGEAHLKVQGQVVDLLQERHELQERLKTEAADPRMVYERDRARELLEQTEDQLIDARRARDEAWRERDRGAENVENLRAVEKALEGQVRSLQARVQGFAQEVCALRQERDQVIADTASAIRGMMADLGQANERNRNLQERLTVAEANGRRVVGPVPSHCADCICSCEGTCKRCHVTPAPQVEDPTGANLTGNGCPGCNGGSSYPHFDADGGEADINPGHIPLPRLR